MKKFSRLVTVLTVAMLLCSVIGCPTDSSSSSNRNNNNGGGSGDGTSIYIGTKSPSEAKAVGDIVFSDGSAIPYTEELVFSESQKSKAVAVIFYVGTELNTGDNDTNRTLGVGLTHTSGLAWCTESANADNKNITTIQCHANGSAETLTFTGDKDGSDNLSQIGTFLVDYIDTDDTTSDTNYPAFTFSKNYAKQTGSRVSNTGYADGWYLPTLAELFQIWKNKKIIDAVGSLCGGSQFGSKEYWSSSQYASANTFASIFDFGSGDFGYYIKHLDEVSVCSIRDFTPYIGTKSPSATKAVGDIVFNDGSATPYSKNLTLTDEQRSKAVAVIFYVGTELNSSSDPARSRTLGVGLTHSSGLAWCTEDSNACNTSITAIQCPVSSSSGTLIFTGDKDGRDNLSQIGAFLVTNGKTDDTSIEEKYPAFYFAKNYSSYEGSHVNGTDYADGWYLPTIAELFQVWKNKEIIDAANSLYGGSQFVSNNYLSSSDYTADAACGLDFGSGAWSSTEKSGNDLHFICAIRDFSLNGDIPARTKAIGKIGKYEKPFSVGDIVFSDGSATPYTEELMLTDEQKAAAIALIFYSGTELNSDTFSVTGHGIDSEMTVTASDTDTVRTLGVGLVLSGKITSSGDGRIAWCTDDVNDELNITTIQCTPNCDDDGVYSFKGDKNGSDNLSQIGSFLTANGKTDDTSIEEKYPAFYFAKNYASQDGSHLSGTDYTDGWYLPSIAELYQIWRIRETLCIVSKLCGGSQFRSTSLWSSSQNQADFYASQWIFIEEGYSVWTGELKGLFVGKDIKNGNGDPEVACAIREF
ncbi:MAG: hypothetical protein IKQ61_09140 [Spirochaetales bacterium]|nr:hypothetical protein [Spirochaetales bacterium]